MSLIDSSSAQPILTDSISPYSVRSSLFGPRYHLTNLCPRTSVKHVQIHYSLGGLAEFFNGILSAGGPNKTRSRNNFLIVPINETVLADCCKMNLKG